MSAIRYRGKKDAIEIAKNLDAFRKLPDMYTETSLVGGTLSLLSRLMIIFLVYKEICYYRQPNLIFNFKTDTNMDEKLQIHLDMTVASPCRSIGTDIVDSTEQNVAAFGSLEEEDTWWQLCPAQKEHFEAKQHMNNFLREEYHSLAEIIFRNILFNDDRNIYHSLPVCTTAPSGPHDACRIHGSLTLNKVAGNIHITPGRSIHFPQGHIHIRNIFDEGKFNFTHRIIKFSFGDSSSRIVQPLEGDEKYISENNIKALYNIEIVPTKIHGFLSTINTFQYSVKQNFKPIETGHPGIYITYDFSALKVIVKPDRDNIIKFIIRLCSITAGIVVISGILKSLVQFTVNLSNTLRPASLKLETPIDTPSEKTTEDNQFVSPPIMTNDLLINANSMGETTVSLAPVLQ